LIIEEHACIDKAGTTERFAKCEDVRSVSKDRLKNCKGMVSKATMVKTKDRLLILMDL